MKKAISTKNAPAAVGPYSQAIEANQTLFISGQLPIDPATGMMPATVEDQARQALLSVEAILFEAGLGLRDVVKTTIFMQDLGGFAAVNRIYGDFFEGTLYPARACVEVAKLPKGALIEIDAIAVRK